MVSDHDKNKKKRERVSEKKGKEKEKRKVETGGEEEKSWFFVTEKEINEISNRTKKKSNKSNLPTGESSSSEELRSMILSSLFLSALSSAEASPFLSKRDTETQNNKRKKMRGANFGSLISRSSSKH